MHLQGLAISATGEAKMNFDKLKFWKKQDDEFSLDLPKAEDLQVPDIPPLQTQQPEQPILQQPMQNLGLQDSTGIEPAAGANIPPLQPITPTSSMQQIESTPSMPTNFEMPTQSQREPQDSRDPSIHPRDIELILAKIETIKISIDHLSTRIENLERQTKDARKW